MTNMLIVAGLCAWLIVALFAIAFIQGADERRNEQTRRIKRMGVTR